MNRILTWGFFACVTALLLFGASARADYAAGEAAWDDGRHIEAVAEWLAAVEEDDGRAMLALGRAFAKGLGVLQDYVEAHKWLNLAAGRGIPGAAAERDVLAAEMSAEERAEARRLAREWRSGTRRTAVAPDPGGLSEPAAGPASTGAPPDAALREAQALLAALGYDPGVADGIWGQRSIHAYRNFLRDAGMGLQDTLTPAALRAMRQRATGQNAELGQAPAAVSPADLHRIVEAGDVAGLQAALDGGAADVNRRGDRGWTPLMLAVTKGYSLLVDPLLAAGADVDIRGPDGATALFMALALGHSDIAAQLLRAGADASVRGPQGKTAEEVAVLRYGDADTARAAGEDPALVALLEGRTWSDVLRATEEAERLVREWPAGKEFRDCAACPKMVVVPADSFMMGSPAGEEGRGEGEGPMHSVEISKPFAVGKFEVTREEFERFVEETGHSTGNDCWTYENGDWEERSGRDWQTPGFSQGSREPAVCMSWDDAEAYVDWLLRKTGAGYRLLSAAEWEYAARAGTTTSRYWGDNPSSACGYANGYDRTGKDELSFDWEHHACRDGHAHTSLVGTFEANGFGLHDMLGNALEWVEDCWHDSYSGAPTDERAWTTGGDCSLRVLRGGSWLFYPSFLRSASRGRNPTGYRDSSLGFRVARTLIP